MPDDSGAKPELHGIPIDRHKNARELDSKSLHELDAQHSRFEVEANTGAAEVEASILPVEVEGHSINREGIKTLTD